MIIKVTCPQVSLRPNPQARWQFRNKAGTYNQMLYPTVQMIDLMGDDFTMYIEVKLKLGQMRILNRVPDRSW